MRRTVHQILSRTALLVCGVSMILGAACKRRETTGKAAESTPSAVAGKLNVGFVYVSSASDGGWSFAHDQGRRYLEQSLPYVHTATIERVAEGAEAEAALRSLSRKGFDLLIAASFGFMDATATVAGEFPKTKFLHIAGYKYNDKNFGNAFGAMESMKYLAGVIAGARAKADGRKKLGYIAPFAIPEVVRLINATAIGMRQSCPDCTMELRFLNAWFDPGREQEAAESLLQAGADVVITGADTSGPVAVAGKHDRWAIGYDSAKACEVDRAHCLTSTYWNWGVLYTQIARQVHEGTWKPTAYYGDVDSGLLGLLGFEEGETPLPGVPAEIIPTIKEKLLLFRKGSLTRFEIFSGPLRDNHGQIVIPDGKRLSQSDLEGLPGCSVCMSWLAEGIVGELPKK
jgi:basic membrane protein A